MKILMKRIKEVNGLNYRYLYLDNNVNLVFNEKTRELRNMKDREIFGEVKGNFGEVNKTELRNVINWAYS